MTSCLHILLRLLALPVKQGFRPAPGTEGSQNGGFRALPDVFCLLLVWLAETPIYNAPAFHFLFPACVVAVAPLCNVPACCFLRFCCQNEPGRALLVPFFY